MKVYQYISFLVLCIFLSWGSKNTRFNKIGFDLVKEGDTREEVIHKMNHPPDDILFNQDLVFKKKKLLRNMEVYQYGTSSLKEPIYYFYFSASDSMVLKKEE